MAHALDQSQLSAGNERGQFLATLMRDQRIRCSMNDQSWRPDALHHRAAIAIGDPARARAAMDSHFNNSIGEMLKDQF